MAAPGSSAEDEGQGQHSRHERSEGSHDISGAQHPQGREARQPPFARGTNELAAHALMPGSAAVASHAFRPSSDFTALPQLAWMGFVVKTNHSRFSPEAWNGTASILGLSMEVSLVSILFI